MPDYPVISTLLNVLLRDRTQGDIWTVYTSYSSSVSLRLHVRNYANSMLAGVAFRKLRRTY